MSLLLLSAGPSLAVNCTSISFSSGFQNYLFTGAASSTYWAFTVSPANCSWTITNDSNFVTISSALSGTGNGEIDYSLTANPGSFRTANLTVSSGSVSTVHQANQNSIQCAIGLSGPSPSGTIPVTGGSYSIDVTPIPSDCKWIPQSTDTWIGGLSPTVIPGASSFTFTVAQNTGPGRQGILSVYGALKPPLLGITQAGNTAALLITNPSPLPAGVAGVGYSQPLAASGGTGPYSFSIPSAGAPPPGLKLSTAGVLSGIPTDAGTFDFPVQVTDSLKFTSTQKFKVTFAAPPPLLASPLKLAFSATAGGDAPPAQEVTIVASTPAAVNFFVLVDGGSSSLPAPAWLTVKPPIGVAPGALIVSVNQTGLAATSYSATIHVFEAGNLASIDIPVSLLVSAAAPQLQVSPSSLRFFTRIQTPGSPDQVIAVANSGGGGPLSITATVVGRSPWITGVTPSSGPTAPNSPLLIRVSISAQGLSVGSYHDVIRISSSAGSVDVAVTLFVAGQGAVLGLHLTGVRFVIREGGGGSSITKTVKVLNLGDPGSAVSWTAVVLGGSSFLSLANSSGQASANNPGSLQLSLTPGVASLTDGARYALVRISDPQALNSPLYLHVVLQILPATSAPQAEPSPSGLAFTTVGGGSAAQSVNVYTGSTTPVGFQAAAVTNDGANWLTANVTTPTATSQTPGVVAVSVNPAGLAAGIYTGGVNIFMNALRTVNVTFIVVGTQTATRSFPSLQPQATAGCTPTRLALAQTGLTNNFEVPAGWPAALVVQLNDDCANPIVNGSVVASFSNGDPPLTLKGDQNSNTYSATWQPHAVFPQMSVNLRGTSGALQPAVAQLIGAIDQNTLAPPVLTPDGALNLYFDGPTAALMGPGLSPGGIAQVYGSGFAPALVSPGVVPLLNQVSGTFMLIGGIQVPLFFVSDSLIAAQIPFELAANREYSMIVSANGALTLPETIDVVTVQPGVGTFPPGTSNVLAQHVADFSLVTAARPAKPGEQVVIYLAGMGPTTPSVKSGDPTPLQQVPATVQPKVTLDGQNVDVSYAGLTPTGVGLYQINLKVPSNARTGTLDLVVTQGGVKSNTTKLPVGP